MYINAYVFKFVRKITKKCCNDDIIMKKQLPLQAVYLNNKD
ncbi:hypothetical protein HMPREF0663_12222 [Hoylesella oralis ATCC 33269]|jgi:hypothetical protein|uniref:Uncharacterized protein n=1 Tax=Hoylesella oralis ATCC 33269 TaxID=873533 RepID=E7RSF4_9BACT|nr:hypothetical protein HMPREF0663_12222 [Hoylesella oralis ATCC 33269]